MLRRSVAISALAAAAFACGRVDDDTRGASLQAPPSDAGAEARADPDASVEASKGACENLVRDGDESDVDCGGSCAKCDDGSTCTTQTDCRGGICESGHCRAGVAQIAAGSDHTCALLTSGRIKCWGANERGQLGVGDRTARGRSATTMGASLPAVDLGKGVYARAVVVGMASSCAILESDRVKCWGANVATSGPGTNLDRGIYPEQMGDALETIDLGTGRTVKELAAGSDYRCAVLDDDTVKCWGGCSNYRCGYADSIAGSKMGDDRPIVPLGTGRTAKAIAAGFSHTCAILDDGNVKCWGVTTQGQVGAAMDSFYVPATKTSAVALGAGHTAKSIIAGFGHTCVILEDDTIKCWGSNSNGQLGTGEISDRGLDASAMGDALPVVDLGAGRKALALARSSSGFHTCALLDDQSVKCWGRNDWGQLGRGDTTDIGGFSQQMGDVLEPVDLGAGIAADDVTVGGGHTCIRAGGRVKCWGMNDGGQLGLEDNVKRGDQLGEMGDLLPFVNVP